ncbi:MAG: PDC sensor domain-containing protein, partial [Bacteroidaceae bacterium]|nr:PDC sensor domain-containing protein [Bacteroidaceae bacterium]
MKIYHIADRLTRWTMITLAVLMAVLMCAIILLSQDFARVESSSRYMSVMRGTNEFVRRSLSDIFVAANNNVHEIESLIDRPDEMLPAMERIVRQTTRVRSCGISFIADYYPEKGHWFLPYAVQLSEDSIQTLNLGGPERDYLHEAWFLEGIETPEGYWAEPYIDSEDSTTPLIAYMLPIHDAQGQTVAVLGVDM